MKSQYGISTMANKTIYQAIANEILHHPTITAPTTTGGTVTGSTLTDANLGGATFTDNPTHDVDLDLGAKNFVTTGNVAGTWTGDVLADAKIPTTMTGKTLTSANLGSATFTNNPTHDVDLDLGAKNFTTTGSVTTASVSSTGEVAADTLNIGGGDATVDADGNWVCPYAEVTEVQTATVTVENPDAGDDQTIVASGAIGAETITVLNNFTCIDGIFGATTVKVGGQTISEAGELVVSDDATPGIIIRDTGDTIATGATGYFAFVDSASVIMSFLKANAAGTFSIAHHEGAVHFSKGVEDDWLILDGDNSVIYPNVDNTVDLGTSTKEFKDLFIDGTAHIDTLDVDINATVAGTLGVTGATTLSSTAAITTSLQVAGGAVITTLGDVAALAASDVKVPTNTTVKEYIDDIGAIGTGNKFWCQGVVGVSLNSTGNTQFGVASSRQHNVLTGSVNANFYCPLPMNIGSYHLVLTTVRPVLLDADGSNYITAMMLYSYDFKTFVTHFNNTTNRTAINTTESQYDETGTWNMDGESTCMVRCECVAATQYAIDMHVMFEGYYTK